MRSAANRLTPLGQSRRPPETNPWLTRFQYRAIHAHRVWWLAGARTTPTHPRVVGSVTTGHTSIAVSTAVDGGRQRAPEGLELHPRGAFQCPARAKIAAMWNRQLCWAFAIALTAILVGCSSSKMPSQPSRPSESAPMSTTGPAPLMTAITVPFEPMELTFSASSNKLYVSGLEGNPPVMRAYVVSLSAPAGAIKRLDTSIDALPHHIVVNDKLRRGYALVVGAIKVFSTDSDTLVSTSQEPSCSPQVLAINQATGMIYGGGLSDTGECLVQFDSDGRIVRENVVAPSVKGKNMLVQRIAVDSASGDVLYTNPSSVGRADQMLTEKWRTPVGGHGEAQDLGFEPKTNTAYVTVGDFPVISPAMISVLDGGTGTQRGEFSGPGWTSEFAATGDGRLFVAFFNSNDLYVLSDGTSTLTKFASLGDIPGSSPSDPKWLAVDTTGRRLFVSPGGDGHKILIYRY